jgi:outer membrane immunogenic protein
LVQRQHDRFQSQQSQDPGVLDRDHGRAPRHRVRPFAGLRLVYGKGGAAFAYDRATETTPVFVQGVGSLDRVGWTVGGGVEYAFTEHFTGRVEYDYLSFSTKVVPLFGSGGLPFATDIIGLTISEAKAGVAYKF